MDPSLNLRRGETVRVRSEEEILATLDRDGALEGLPFMPEMRAFCGQRFRVRSRADKTCDTISGEIRARRMHGAVHLEDVRCDGSSHGGCEAACSIFWKEAWLERVGPPRTHPLWSWVADAGEADPPPQGSQTEPAAAADVDRAARRSDGETDDEPHYRCQVTQLLAATGPLDPGDFTQYLRDWLSGNVSIFEMSRIAFLRFIARFVYGRGFSYKVRAYDALAGLLGESSWPYHPGRLDGPTPRERLDLQPGELVTVKSHAEILDTLKDRSNRGLSFAPEMVRYCGGTYRVRARVSRILDEGSGRMLQMNSDCIVLEDVVCRSECSANRLFCPRAIYPYWREIWLRRVE